MITKDLENEILELEEIEYEANVLKLLTFKSINQVSLCSGVVDLLLSHTYSEIESSSLREIYNNAYNISLIIKDILDSLSIKYALDATNLKLIILGNSKYQIYSGYEDYKGILTSTLSDSKAEISTFIHEIAHAFFDLMFENDSNPFSIDNYEIQNIYHKAFKDFLVNIAHDFLRINLSESEIYNNHVYDIAQYLKQNSLLDIFELCLTYKYYKFFPNKEDVNIAYNKYLNHSTNSELNVGNMIEHLYEYAKTNLNRSFSEDELILLGRVVDLIVNRDIEDYDRELIVRYPELKVLQINSEVMEYFRPLEEFWITYITPEVEKLRDVHNAECFNICQMEADNYPTCSNNTGYIINCIDWNY
ncbi:hypothetical protein NOVO_08185 [Rickettsiales bacterium Ac37b]|nr:hypothetical protein NOVO_08185 [Rickettsiales bacterium Ac37b]